MIISGSTVVGAMSLFAGGVPAIFPQSTCDTQWVWVSQKCLIAGLMFSRSFTCSMIYVFFVRSLLLDDSSNAVSEGATKPALADD